MPKYVRSAKGELVDFELLAIKAQLAAIPVPKAVADRKVQIDLRDGVKQGAENPLISELLGPDAIDTSSRARSVKRK